MADFKTILKELKSDNWYMVGAKNKAIEALYEYDGEHGGLDIISYEVAEEIAKNELEKGGLARISCFLAETTSLDDDYYRLNGYGNLCDITYDWLVDTIEEIVAEGEEK